MTDRIDHAREARQHIAWAHETQETEGSTERTVTDNALLAQVHATLALVEQQRIANRIALAVARSEAQRAAGTRAAAVLSGPVGLYTWDDATYVLQADIAEGLFG